MVQVALENAKLAKLKNPPLVETIFELRWELKGDPQTGRYKDPAYPIMYGRLSERLKEELPLIEDLPSIQAHPEATPYVVRHRLRKEKESWPLIQIGPGILTVNASKEYSWSTFRSLISSLIELVVELFPKDEMPLHFIKMELRYVNGIMIGQNDPLSFLKDNLNLTVVPPEFSSAVGVNLSLAFPVDEIRGHSLVSINLGTVGENPAFLFQNSVQTIGENAAGKNPGQWLEAAHSIALNQFIAYCKGNLLKEFEGS
jgi:uncharacterized protein (TIGR04255 family)